MLFIVINLKNSTRKDANSLTHSGSSVPRDVLFDLVDVAVNHHETQQLRHFSVLYIRIIREGSLTILFSTSSSHLLLLDLVLFFFLENKD